MLFMLENLINRALNSGLLQYQASRSSNFFLFCNIQVPICSETFLKRIAKAAVFCLQGRIQNTAFNTENIHKCILI